MQRHPCVSAEPLTLVARKDAGFDLGATGENQHLSPPGGGGDLVEAGCCQEVFSIRDADRSTAKHMSRVVEDGYVKGIRRAANGQGNNDPSVRSQCAVDQGDTSLERGARNEGLRQPRQVKDPDVGKLANRLQPQLDPTGEA
jgi:hypothetical protein